MADQLAGHWYCSLSNSALSIVDADKAVQALKTIYAHNVLKFADGRLGAVNGMLRSGGVDRSTVQSEEVGTGIKYLGERIGYSGKVSFMLKDE